MLSIKDLENSFLKVLGYLEFKYAQHFLKSWRQCFDKLGSAFDDFFGFKKFALNYTPQLY